MQPFSNLSKSYMELNLKILKSVKYLCSSCSSSPLITFLVRKKSYSLHDPENICQFPFPCYLKVHKLKKVHCSKTYYLSLTGWLFPHMWKLSHIHHTIPLLLIFHHHLQTLMLYYFINKIGFTMYKMHTKTIRTQRKQQTYEKQITENNGRYILLHWYEALYNLFIFSFSA